MLSIPENMCQDVAHDQHPRMLAEVINLWGTEAVLLLKDHDALFSRCHDLFRLLDFHAISLSPKLVLADFAGAQLHLRELTHRCWGARVDYDGCIVPHAEVDGPPAHRPRMTVTPVLMLRRQDGAWFRVVQHPHGVDEDGNRGRDFLLPPGRGSHGEYMAALAGHVDALRGAGDALLSAVQANIEGVQSLPTMSLGDMSVLEGSRSLPSLVDHRDTHSWLVLGDLRHFVVPPTTNECPGHTAAKAAHKWGQSAEHVGRPRSERPRCFTPDGHVLHCAQHKVVGLKELSSSPTPGTDSRRDRNAPFCRMFRLDARQCCRTCAYLEVCLGDESNHLTLPCSKA